MTRSNLGKRILEYIQANNQARAVDLVRALSPISRMSIHKQLKKLTASGQLQKTGKPPLVFYQAIKGVESPVLTDFPKEAKEIIERDYLYISPKGDLLYGLDGFTKWATNTNQEGRILHLAEIYGQTRDKFDKYQSRFGWIDATFKMRETFSDLFLDKLLYADFYSLPQFGKTKLGSLMLYAKQSQNRELIKKVSLSVGKLISKIIKEFKIEAVAFIPPSVPRGIQFMTELANYLRLPLPQIDLVKTRTGQVIVAQKTLEKLEERVVNARETIFVKNNHLPYTNVLLIDDAVGSGASMNETAKKIKRLGQVKKVIGFSVVGSFKGFEIIREV